MASDQLTRRDVGKKRARLVEGGKRKSLFPFWQLESLLVKMHSPLPHWH